MILFNSAISAVLAVGLAAIFGYMAGHRAGSRATRERGQSGDDHWKDHAEDFERSLADAISAEFAMMIRYKEGFSVVVFDLDNIEQMGRDQSDPALRYIDRQLAKAVRETDAVVRYGGNHFFVLMPRTDLQGACEFGERFREAIEDASSVTVSGGITTALDGDSPGLMGIRVDEALASAKQSEGNCMFRHDGCRVEPVLELVFTGDSAGDSARG